MRKTLKIKTLDKFTYLLFRHVQWVPCHVGQSDSTIGFRYQHDDLFFEKQIPETVASMMPSAMPRGLPGALAGAISCPTGRRAIKEEEAF